MATFGNTTDGSTNNSIEGYIRGGVYPFSGTTGSTADSIFARLCTNQERWYSPKCALYNSDLSYIATTNVLSQSYPITYAWYEFTFSDPKPTLTNGNSYIIVVWAENENRILSVASSGTTGVTNYYQFQIMNGWPDPLAPTTSAEQYCVYCSYSYTPPPHPSPARDFLLQPLPMGKQRMMFRRPRPVS